MIRGPERQRLALAAAMTLRRNGPLPAPRLLLLLSERGLSGDESVAVLALGLAVGLIERDPSDRRLLRARPGVRSRLLVVDGDPDERAMLGKVLSQLGYEVRVAPSAAAGLRVLDEAALGRGDPLPDALLVDLRVPDMGGLDLIDAIRSRRALPRVRLVATSERPEDGARLRGVPFVPKPLRLGALLTALSSDPNSSAAPRSPA